MAAVAFANFSKLPAELQLMVWKASLPGTRIVELFASRETEDPQTQLFRVSEISHRPLFRLRFACLDSSRVVKKIYLSYLLRDLGRRDVPKESIILLDNSVDVVMFSGVHTLSYFSGYPYGSHPRADFLASLQTVTIPIPYDSLSWFRNGDSTGRFIHDVSSLRKVIWTTTKAVDNRFREQELSFRDVAEPNVALLQDFRFEWEQHVEESGWKDRLSKIDSGDFDGECELGFEDEGEERSVDRKSRNG